MRVAVWLKDSQAAPTDPVARTLHEFQRNLTGPISQGLIAIDLEQPALIHPMCGTTSETSFSNFYFFELYMVDLDAQGNVTHIYPSEIYGLETAGSTTAGTSNQAYLQSQFMLPGTTQIDAKWLSPGGDPDSVVGSVTQTATLPNTPLRKPVVSW